MMNCESWERYQQIQDVYWSVSPISQHPVLGGGGHRRLEALV
jgi:hypothetical protein